MYCKHYIYYILYTDTMIPCTASAIYTIYYIRYIIYSMYHVTGWIRELVIRNPQNVDIAHLERKHTAADTYYYAPKEFGSVKLVSYYSKYIFLQSYCKIRKIELSLAAVDCFSKSSECFYPAI